MIDSQSSQNENNKGESRQESVRLNYFNIRGNGQPVRNLLYHLYIAFEDVVHPKTEYNEKECGFNFGLPYLEDSEIRVYEATAIMIYLCKREKREALIGLTPQHAARINEALMKYYNQKKKIMSLILYILCKFRPSNEQECVDKGLTHMIYDFRFIYFCLKSIYKKHFIFYYLTIVDFVFYEICFYIVGFFGPYLRPRSIFNRFFYFKKNFEQLPFFERHKKQIINRPLFFYSVKASLNQSIYQYWKVCAHPIIKQMY